MVAGVGLFGVVTASFAAWLVDQLRDEETANEQATRADLLALREQLDRIEERIAALDASATTVSGPDVGDAARKSRRQRS
jgi:voltage-gated potassium channel